VGSESTQRIRYRDYDVVLAGGPSGSPTLAQLLAMFDLLNLRRHPPGSPEALHGFAEIMRIAYSDRLQHLGDPASMRFPIDRFYSRSVAADRARLVDPTRATLDVAPGFVPPESSCTTHFTIVDSARNVVTCTLTNGLPFGSGVVIPETGLLMLNNMHQFDPVPGSPNSVAAGRCPVWNGTPVLLLKDGRPVMALGSTGGRQIQSIVVQAIVNVVDHGMSIQDALALPTVHCEGRETQLDARFPAQTREALGRLGHSVRTTERNCLTVALGRPNGVFLDNRSGLLHGGVDVYGIGECIGC
jgi:gamma-glutamyltranspeptidase/glutathione hydrolase